MNTHLVIIDPQNDFCDPKRGALYVKGAERDMANLARFVERQGNLLSAIHVTLDSHQSIHIAHPIFWKDAQENHPSPFTTITRGEVEAGKWVTTNPNWQQKGLAYVQALEKHGRYQLMIWPPHCRIGTWGHGVFPGVADALLAWEERFLKRVNFVMKGNNSFTEHYSAVVADVPDPADSSTALNTRLLEALKKADRILVSGEALSHCVANTVTDIASHIDQTDLKKFVLLKNTSSNVAGCESMGESFVENMTRRGMRIMTTEEALT